MLLAIAVVAYEAQLPGKDSGKPPANAASGGAGTPQASEFRTTSGAELGPRERSGKRKPRTTRAELPDDPSQIKELTPELAKRLLAKFKGDDLTLNGLTTLDADTREATMVAIRPMAQCGEFCDAMMLTRQATRQNASMNWRKDLSGLMKTDSDINHAWGK